MYGIYDFATQKLISPKYSSSISAFYSGKPQNVLWKRVNEKKKQGLMDINEKMLIPLEYDDLEFYEQTSKTHETLIKAVKSGQEPDFFTENGTLITSQTRSKPKCMCD